MKLGTNKRWLLKFIRVDETEKDPLLNRTHIVLPAPSKLFAREILARSGIARKIIEVVETNLDVSR